MQPSNITFNSVTHTSNSITVAVTATDDVEKNGSGQSGIKELYFSYSSDNGNKWSNEEKQTTTGSATITFTSLTQTTEYKVRVRAVDNAGNSTTTNYGNTVKTETVTKLTDANTKFTYDPTGWTKETVRVTIEVSSDVKNGYTLQYQKNSNGAWQEYKTPVEVTENNTAINARLWDGKNGGGTATGNVTKIDKNMPGGSIEITSTTTKSITVNVKATDGTSESGISKIKIYCKGSGNVGTVNPVEQEFTEVNSDTQGQQTQTYTNTFNSLKSGTAYTIYAEITDVAGNTYDTANSSVTTTAIPSLSDTNLTYSPETWTNNNVTIAINYTATLPEGCELQYSLGTNTNWNKYDDNNRPTIATNQKVYARIYDGTNSSNELSKQVAIIDKENPNTPSFNAKSSTTNSITVTGTATDKPANNNYGSSGIKELCFSYSSDGGSNWLNEQKQATEKSAQVTFKGLIQNKEYKVKVKAVDKAGNSAEYIEIIKTGTVTGLTGSDTTFEYDPKGWTNGKVTVKITTRVNSNNAFELQYSVGNTDNWQKYTTSVEVNKNTQIYARLYDGVNGGNHATGNVTKIDTTKPSGQITGSSFTTKSIAVNLTATDEANGSGIYSIKWFCQTTGETAITSVDTWGTKNGETTGASSKTTSHTFNNLKSGTAYTIYAEITDVAGNDFTTGTTNVTTAAMPSLAATNISWAPKDWTNQKVQVTITASTNQSGCRVQYRLDNEATWKDYTKVFDVTSNTKIHARFTDDFNNGNEVSQQITNIDTVKPIGTLTTKATTKSITVTVKATDDLSGLKTITWYCKKPNGEVIKSDTKTITK